MGGRKGDQAGTIGGPGHFDRHVGRPVVAGESQFNRRLLPRMKAINNIAVALLGFLERLQARNDAVNREIDSLEYRTFTDPVRSMDRVDGVGFEFEDERISVVVDPPNALDGQAAQKLPRHAWSSPTGLDRSLSAARTAL